MPSSLTLEGDHVRLEPLTLGHLDALCEVGLDPELWRWTSSDVRDRAGMQAYIETALKGQRRGRMRPFATVHRASGRVVGSTRFGNIVPEHRRAEIGWTWVARPWQRTAVNTEAKWLMLRHAFSEGAFGTPGCQRVEIKTDVLNARSRKAILRLGATEEGVLRQHVITATGRTRDTIYYSILADEWPRVEAALRARLHLGREER
ncbi:MAG: GNAT family N-acetyltransferase [Bacteroidota bacterium]